MQFVVNWCVRMIQVLSGHLGSGRWHFKEIDNVVVLAHSQAFNRHGEFRIGPDQVVSYEIETQPENKQESNVKINFSDERYCRASIPNKDLPSLQRMVESEQAAPAFELQIRNQKWVNGLIIFFIAFILIELIR